jgi:hypothetical protein
MAKQCDLVIGYLLPRRCEAKATAECTKCGRNVCKLHARMGDTGLLCRDCFEERQPRSLEDLEPLPEPVERRIYRREGFGSSFADDTDYGLFETEEEEDAFSTLT